MMSKTRHAELGVVYDIDTAFDRLMEMAPEGITVERKDRLEQGQWVVTCERRVGEYPNDRYIRVKHIYWTRAIELAYEMFQSA